MVKAVKKRFDIEVPAENAQVSQTFELDKNIVAISGLLISSNRDELLYYRGTQKIEINKEEIFPEGYESKLLMSGINVSPNRRYYGVGEVKPGNGDVKIEFRDQPDARAAFEPYRVTLYLDCKMDDEI